jgi:hypothetical protein
VSYDMFSAFKERGIRPKLGKPVVVKKAALKASEGCTDHQPQLYKQYIGSDNQTRMHHLVLRACPNCRSKEVVDLKVS